MRVSFAVSNKSLQKGLKRIKLVYDKVSAAYWAMNLWLEISHSVTQMYISKDAYEVADRRQLASREFKIKSSHFYWELAVDCSEDSNIRTWSSTGALIGKDQNCLSATDGLGPLSTFLHLLLNHSLDHFLPLFPPLSLCHWPNSRLVLHYPDNRTPAAVHLEFFNEALLVERSNLRLEERIYNVSHDVDPFFRFRKDRQPISAGTGRQDFSFLYFDLLKHLLQILNSACTCDAGHVMPIHALEMNCAVFGEEGTERLEDLIGWS